jgi:hypothetical protein
VPFDAATGAAELARDTLPDVPAVVLTRAPGRWRDPRADATVDQTWRGNQATLARLCRAPLVTAADAGHDLPGEAPGLVAYTIDQVVLAVRSYTSRVVFDPAHVATVGGAAVQR